MRLQQFLEKLKSSPETVEFEETMQVIETIYDYTPTAFSNGKLNNQAGENEGSCKLFAFAKLNQLTKDQTLACFGAYYREDVLQNPQGDSHQNIRNFMLTGWEGISFKQISLVQK